MRISRERADGIADALTFAGDDWPEVLDRVPEYDADRTARARKRLDRGSWASRDDGAFLADGTLLVRDRDDGRWTASHPADLAPLTPVNLVRSIRHLAADERSLGNPHPLRTVTVQAAWAIIAPVRRKR